MSCFFSFHVVPIGKKKCREDMAKRHSCGVQTLLLLILTFYKTTQSNLVTEDEQNQLLADSVLHVMILAYPYETTGSHFQHTSPQEPSIHHVPVSKQQTVPTQYQARTQDTEADKNLTKSEY